MSSTEPKNAASNNEKQRTGAIPALLNDFQRSQGSEFG
jgi:hypothetical protein